MNPFAIFKDKYIIITGHTESKESWLAQLGTEDHGFSLPPNTEPNHYTTANITELLKSEKLGDIRDCKAIADYIRSIKPNCIFQSAAQPLVRRSYAEPVKTFNTNIMGSISITDAVRSLGKNVFYYDNHQR